MVKLLEVAAVSEELLNVSELLPGRVTMFNAVNVATPLTALTVAPFKTSPARGLIIAAVTLALELATRLP